MNLEQEEAVNLVPLFFNQQCLSKMKEKIGTNAGLVWNALNGKGELNLKDLKKLTKLSEKDLYAALGWLSREEKVAIEEKEKEIFISIA